MPLGKLSAQQHEAQATHNYELYKQLRNDAVYFDWAVTLLFYTVLHLAQAYLVEVASNGFDIPKGHDDRGDYIQRKLLSIYNPYRFLETRSRWARYDLSKPKPTSQMVDNYHDQQFMEIVNYLANKGVSLQNLT